MADAGSSDGSEQVLQKDRFGGSLGFIVATVVIATIVLALLWRSFNSSNKKLKATGAFTPPEEREKYIEAKSKAGDAKDPLVRDNLRKLLTKRALKAIPLILSLQNEGQSIDRLYKKGMLTDDMHFRVKELKAFVDQEYQDVQAEANELMEGWGEHVWQQAMQTHVTIQRQLESAKQQREALAQAPAAKPESAPAKSPSSSSSASAKEETKPAAVKDEPTKAQNKKGKK